MPHKITLREGEAIEIGGVSLALAHARGREAVFYLAGYDDCGLIEGPEETKAAAARFRARIDKPYEKFKDY